MHVNAKKMAVSGLALALSVIAIILSGVLEFNTLFLLGAASFMIGIIIQECGLRLGFAFYVSAVLLGAILAPNKLYCITFGAMGFYVLAIETVWRWLYRIKTQRNQKVIFWISKFVIFNLLYLPMLFFFPRLLFERNMSKGLLLGAVLAGQAVLIIYDKAYECFLVSVWGEFRKKLRIDH